MPPGWTEARGFDREDPAAAPMVVAYHATVAAPTGMTYPTHLAWVPVSSVEGNRAVKAAERQGDGPADRLLRRLREGLVRLRPARRHPGTHPRRSRDGAGHRRRVPRPRSRRTGGRGGLPLRLGRGPQTERGGPRRAGRARGLGWGPGGVRLRAVRVPDVDLHGSGRRAHRARVAAVGGLRRGARGGGPAAPTPPARSEPPPRPCSTGRCSRRPSSTSCADRIRSRRRMRSGTSRAEVASS
jgi:hypothetical protein